MTDWNMFSDEVIKEMNVIRVYGGVEKALNRYHRAPSYKAQALRELANRILLQQEIQDLNRSLLVLIDRLEAADLDATTTPTTPPVA